MRWCRSLKTFRETENSAPSGGLVVQRPRTERETACRRRSPSGSRVGATDEESLCLREYLPGSDRPLMSTLLMLPTATRSLREGHLSKPREHLQQTMRPIKRIRFIRITPNLSRIGSVLMHRIGHQ